MPLGAFLTAARGGRCQKDLADELGVTQSTISSWESGDTVPRRDRLRAVAHAYRVDFAALAAMWMVAPSKSGQAA